MYHKIFPLRSFRFHSYILTYNINQILSKIHRSVVLSLVGVLNVLSLVGALAGLAGLASLASLHVLCLVPGGAARVLGGVVLSGGAARVLGSVVLSGGAAHIGGGDDAHGLLGVLGVSHVGGLLHASLHVLRAGEGQSQTLGARDLSAHVGVPALLLGGHLKLVPGVGDLLVVDVALVGVARRSAGSAAVQAVSAMVARGSNAGCHTSSHASSDVVGVSLPLISVALVSITLVGVALVLGNETLVLADALVALALIVVGVLAGAQNGTRADASPVTLVSLSLVVTGIGSSVAGVSSAVLALEVLQGGVLVAVVLPQGADVLALVVLAVLGQEAELIVVDGALGVGIVATLQPGKGVEGVSAAAPDGLHVLLGILVAVALQEGHLLAHRHSFTLVLLIALDFAQGFVVITLLVVQVPCVHIVVALAHVSVAGQLVVVRLRGAVVVRLIAAQQHQGFVHVVSRGAQHAVVLRVV